MIKFHREGHKYIMFRLRAFYVGVIVAAVLCSMLVAYTATVRSDLSDAQARIAWLEKQLRANEGLLIPPQKAPAGSEH